MSSKVPSAHASAQLQMLPAMPEPERREHLDALREEQPELARWLEQHLSAAPDPVAVETRVEHSSDATEHPPAGEQGSSSGRRVGDFELLPYFRTVWRTMKWKTRAWPWTT